MLRLPLIVALIVLLPAFALADGASGARSIEVSAEGVMDAVPDAFVLTAGIHTRDKDLDKARADASARSAKMIEAAKAFPVDRARTFTSSFMIRPIYENQSADFIAHDVTQTIRFTISDPKQAESFTTEMVKAGATSIDSIEFVTTKADDLWQPARKKALENARVKAAALAEVLNQKIGQPLSIKTQDYSNETALGCRWDPLRGDTTAAAPDKLHLVAPANIKIRANVQVEFALIQQP
jgi:uncharacterized protein YggE